MIDNNTTASNNLSNNDIACSNFSQNTLISFDGVFNGLEKTVGLLIPSVRNVIVERYRAETTAIILNKAIKILKENGLTINQIPPKVALPLFDKLSLEHEEDMYDFWAKLLVNAAVNYDPIQIQYADILSNIGANEARLLQNMYNVQTKYMAFNVYANRVLTYSSDLEFYNTERFLFKALEIKILDTLSYIRKFYKIPSALSIKIKHSFRKLTTRAEKDFRGYSKELIEMSKPFQKQEFKHSICILENVGLISKEFRNFPVLSVLGYEFVKTLERDNVE